MSIGSGGGKGSERGLLGSGSECVKGNGTDL